MRYKQRLAPNRQLQREKTLAGVELSEFDTIDRLVWGVLPGRSGEDFLRKQ